MIMLKKHASGIVFQHKPRERSHILACFEVSFLDLRFFLNFMKFYLRKYFSSVFYLHKPMNAA